MLEYVLARCLASNSSSYTLPREGGVYARLNYTLHAVYLESLMYPTICSFRIYWYYTGITKRV
jgi:hypothetical protein